jgi:predicted RNase H-like HicB family nuclease
MIKKSTIRKAATCWWSAEDEVYLVESPLFERVGAQGDTEAEAMSQFESNLEFAYEQLLHNNVGGYDKGGRPAKNGVHVHVQLKPETKQTLSEMTKELGITQGELIDWAVFALTHHQKKPTKNLMTVMETGSIYDAMLANACVPGKEIDIFKTALIGKIIKMGDSDIRDIAEALTRQVK